MYKAFNLKLGQSTFTAEEHAQGRQVLDRLRPVVTARLKTCIREDGSIDGSRLRDEWFPKRDTRVFISHSHQDEASAVGLVGWFARLGIQAFVDSGVWGDANSLLREIDDKHCRNWDNSTYSYEKRNSSTAHVHTLLSTALAAMMDHTECVMFLNTHASAPISDSMEKTASPWIFFEIETANRLRRRLPREQHLKKAMDESAQQRDMKVYYDLQLEDFVEIDMDTLRKWATQNPRPTSEQWVTPLDSLYRLPALRWKS